MERIRVTTGVPKLDQMLEGGFVKGSCVLVSGETGSGKTIFGCQFLNEGLKKKESVLYITLEETPREIINDVARFGWDFSDLMTSIELIDPKDVDNIEEMIREKVLDTGAQRVVIDSLTLIGSFLSNEEGVIRRKFHNIKKTLKDLGVTAILISEVAENGNSLSKYGIEEFIVDGIIILNVGFDVVGSKPRSLLIRKMRRTDHNLDVHPIDISKNGIEII